MWWFIEIVIFFQLTSAVHSNKIGLFPNISLRLSIYPVCMNQISLCYDVLRCAELPIHYWQRGSWIIVQLKFTCSLNYNHSTNYSSSTLSSGFRFVDVRKRWKHTSLLLLSVSLLLDASILWTDVVEQLQVNNCFIKCFWTIRPRHDIRSLLLGGYLSKSNDTLVWHVRKVTMTDINMFSSAKVFA